MGDTLTITRTGGPVTVLALVGELTANTERQFVEAAREIRAAGAERVLIDMNGVDMLTSAGLRALHAALLLFTPREEIEVFQKANPGDIFKSPAFKIAGATPMVYSVLSMAGFLHNIPIFPDVQQALVSFTN